jgi:hypothetical protein
MSQKHVSDDRLIEMCLTGAAADGDDAHIAGCAPCELRRLTLAQMLDDVATAADADVDAAFPADRLARQRARILQRIELEGRPGRLISFPAAQAQPAKVRRARPRVRWAAGAVAAAFVVGMVAGHLAHDLPVPGSDVRMVANERDTSPLRPVSTTWSEEEFLAQIEQAAIRVSPAALGPLDALTPRAWEAAR